MDLDWAGQDASNWEAGKQLRNMNGTYAVCTLPPNLNNYNSLLTTKGLSPV